MRELSAQDLATVNDLLAAQLRAGLPLEPGLRAAAADWPGQAGSVLRDLTERLERGESLEQALTAAGDVPVEYAALVEAGKRSGDMPKVLDELTKLAELRLQSRRTVLLAVIYPSFVALAAIFLGYFLWTRLLPAFVADLVDAQSPVPSSLGYLARWGSAIGKHITLPAMAAIMLALLAVFLVAIARLGPWSERHMERLPWLGKAWREASVAHWARLIAVLLEHGTPEDQAVELAARASGFGHRSERFRAVADTIRAGNRPSRADWQATGVGALAAWAVSGSGNAQARTAALRLVAANHERSASARMLLASRLFPLFLLVLVGGTFTLVYGLVMFAPLARLYEGLGGTP